MPTQRQQRLSRLFREEISELLLRHLKDPRLGMITITEVRIAPDLSQAIVYVSPQGSPRAEPKEEAEARRQSLEGLVSAAGHIRTELGRRLRLRRIPELDFRLDDTQERADRVEDLLDQVSRETRAPE